MQKRTSRLEKVLTNDFLVDRYVIKKHSSVAIGNQVGANATTVVKYLRKYNIPVRSSGTRIGTYYSQERKEKHRLGMLGKNNGKPCWSKGFTKETNNSLKRSSSNIRASIKKKWLDPVYIQKQYLTRTTPEYMKKMEARKSKYIKCGYFTSYKNNCEIYFRSSYELYSFILLEHNSSVKQYGTCYFSIPYLFEGKAHRYIPNIMVEYIDGSKAIVEVKPTGRLQTAVNVIKFEVGARYCRENGMQYVIWTEYDIETKLADRHATCSAKINKTKF
jgi:hypothetical protein